MDGKVVDAEIDKVRLRVAMLNSSILFSDCYAVLVALKRRQ